MNIDTIYIYIPDAYRDLLWVAEVFPETLWALLVCADLALLLTRPVVIIDGRSLAQWGRWWGVDWTAPWLIHYRIVYIYIIYRCVFVWESVLPVGCLQYIFRTFIITESTKQTMCGDFSSDKFCRALRKTPPGSGVRWHRSTGYRSPKDPRWSAEKFHGLPVKPGFSAPL